MFGLPPWAETTLIAAANLLYIALALLFPRSVGTWPDVRHSVCPRCGLPRFHRPAPYGTPACLCWEALVSGYADRIRTLKFDELTEADDSLVFVALRNPRRVPPAELVPRDVVLDEAGRPVDQAAAAAASYEVISRLIVAWHAYDATDFAVGEDGEPAPQRPLPLPATPELVAKLPLDIIRAINVEIEQAVNPQ